MSLEQIKKLIDENKDNEEVQAYLRGLNPVTVEGLQSFVKTDIGKKWLDSEKDKHHNKALETWKTNNLDTIIEEEVNKRNPQKTPEQVELEKLRKEIEGEREARNRESLVNKALKVAKEKNLPDGIIDFFIGKDEENTLSNLGKLEEEYSKAVQSAVDTKFKEHGRDIEQGGITPPGAIDIHTLAQEASIRK